ncbi:MAG TPA: Gfo/Idh/MocA family oxidoreductase [Deinococcales bacterium]|nr:Gfo/Idh/MocA family oxidoreductase [Deinococcales bacterium]
MRSPSSAAPLRLAILGPGKVAHTHARAVLACPQAKLEAVIGRNPQRTRDFAAAHGARPLGSLDEALEDDAVDAVIICTPHPLHADAAVKAAQAGRHVLVEKPLATTSADCDRISEAAARSGATVAVVSQRRLYEPAQRVRAAIETGKIGRPVLAVATLLGWRGPDYYSMDAWRGTWAGEGGGVLINQAVHQIDMLLWFMGPAVEVHGYVANQSHPTIEVEDTAVANIRFACGALGSIVASNSQNPGLWGRVHVHGSNGASVGVQTDGGSSFVAGVTSVLEPPVNDLWTVPGEEGLLASWQEEDRARAAHLDVAEHYHHLLLADFVDAVLSGSAPLVSAAEGRRATELIEAIYHSSRSGRSVRLGGSQDLPPGPEI